MAAKKNWLSRLLNSITGSGYQAEPEDRADPEDRGVREARPQRTRRGKSGPTEQQVEATRLQLLWRFVRPCSPDDVLRDGGWTERLGESPQKAIQRFVDEGLLEQLPLDERLDALLKVPDLKKMLKSRGLPLSGKKAQLIERLLEADKQGVEAEFKGKTLLRCTARGKETAEQQGQAERDRREAVEQQVMEALRQRQYATASRLVAQFEASQPFSRGMGVDWKNHDASHDVFVLTVIMERTPKALAKTDPSGLAPIRIAAGMMYLWGVSRAVPWLPPAGGMDAIVAQAQKARVLVAHAQFASSIEGYKQSGTKGAEIIGGDSCPACKRIQGKKYKLNSVPELPYEGCTAEGGCCCTVVPVVD